MEKFEGWIEAVTRGHSVRQIAANAQIPPATLSRQISTGTVTPENAVAIAVAYGASPVKALVALGVLDPDNVDTMSVEQALREATDQQLVDEVMRRLSGATEEDTAFDHPTPVPIRPTVVPGDEDDLTVSQAPVAVKKAARNRRRRVDMEIHAE